MRAALRTRGGTTATRRPRSLGHSPLTPPPATDAPASYRPWVLPGPIGGKPAFLTLHVACVALSARQIRRRVAKAYRNIRLSRPTPKMPAERQPGGPV